MIKKRFSVFLSNVGTCSDRYCSQYATPFGIRELFQRAEHYQVSMNVGELVLFPAVRQASSSEPLAAPGTSCRHQIHDGTGRVALHPAQCLHQALQPPHGV